MRMILGLTVLSLLVAQEPANQPAQAGPKTDPAPAAVVSPVTGPDKPSQPSNAPVAAGAPAKPKQNGLARQRASLRRQVGNPDEIGWFFWPWPSLGGAAAQPQKDEPAAAAPPEQTPAPQPVP